MADEQPDKALRNPTNVSIKKMQNAKKKANVIRKKMAELRTQPQKPYAARSANEAHTSSRTEASPYRHTC